jgi:ribosome-associated protein
MDIKTLEALVVDALEDIKARDIEVINTQSLTSLFDRLVIASGDSNRQTRALARHVQDKVKEAGGSVISVEGEETGEWVLVDLGDIVVHVMQPAVRAYYNLEELWSGSAKPSDRSAAAARATGVRGRGPGPDAR